MASTKIVQGSTLIKSEDGYLNKVVYVDVRNRDVGGYVAEAKSLLEKRLALPTGYRLEWSGQYEAMQRASKRLRVVVPITLLIIFGLLYFNFRSTAESLIVMLSLPFALAGGVWLMWILGYNLSVAVAIGFIASQAWQHKPPLCCSSTSIRRGTTIWHPSSKQQLRQGARTWTLRWSLVRLSGCDRR